MTVTTDAPVKTKQAAANGASAAEVRSWLRDNGHEVGARGTIRADLMAAFDAAHPA